MNSQVTDDFIRCFRQLPDDVKELARQKYRLWKQNPWHPGIRFKRIHADEPLYSVRVGRSWRAVGMLEGDMVTWFWIGSHADYDTIIG